MPAKRKLSTDEKIVLNEDVVSRSGRKRKIPAKLLDDEKEALESCRGRRKSSVDDDQFVTESLQQMLTKKVPSSSQGPLAKRKQKDFAEVEPEEDEILASSVKSEEEDEFAIPKVEEQELCNISGLQEEDFDSFKRNLEKELMAGTGTNKQQRGRRKATAGRRTSRSKQQQADISPADPMSPAQLDISSTSDVELDLNTPLLTMSLKKNLQPGANLSTPPRSAAKKNKKKKLRITAFSLWSQNMRPQLKKQHPTFDFGQISQLMVEMWHSVLPTQKQMWSRKARKVRETGQKPIVLSQTPTSTTFMRAGQNKGKAESSAAPKYKVVGHDEVAVAAHLSLLGESLAIIGSRLQQHQKPIAVQGSVSVLLDSLICAMGSLMCLTAQIPEMNSVPSDVHDKTLDNIAYIMPGIG